MKLILIAMTVSCAFLVGCASTSDLKRVEETANKASADAKLATECCVNQNIQMNKMFRKFQYK